MPAMIRVAHSPDSDDAFMFYALAAGKIDTGDRRYLHELQDIESLNTRALKAELEVTAVSFHAYAYLHDRYALLPHGCSMGDGYGPRLVARQAMRGDVHDALAGKLVSIPGERTTANLTLKLLRPDVRTVLVPFDAIEDHVLAGESDVGLLIHEGQLTYQGRGLHLWQDLGAWWKERTGLPLPLGGNVVRKDLGETMIRLVSRDLRASIVYGLEHRVPALAHAQQYARGLDPAHTDTFVGMYVNDFTVDYGEIGRAAVARLMSDAFEAGLIPKVTAEFVDDRD
jgi:1,4-dihydroxy-6-naphthoate synthase